jgi:sialidase-1
MVFSALILTLFAAAAAVEPQQVDVYVGGQDGYRTYRIPSLVVTTRGTVLAFCEGRKYGDADAGKIDLLLKRSTDGGRTFSRQQIVWADENNTCGNPCAVVERQTGKVVLLMTHNLGSDMEWDIMDRKSKGTRTAWLTESGDDGRTWSPPRQITRQVKPAEWTWYATGPGAGIQLADGRLVIPCCHGEIHPNRYTSHVILSDDRGAHWKLGGSTGSATDECEVVERSDGSLLLNLRNSCNHKFPTRATAVSRDAGLTWSKIEHDPALVEPECQASIRRLATAGGKGPAILFSNPADAHKRQNMTVRLSRDEGKTWPVSKLLWPRAAAYSCLAVLPDGTIFCFYERGAGEYPYEKITLARFSRGWLETPAK